MEDIVVYMGNMLLVNIFGILSIEIMLSMIKCHTNYSFHVYYPFYFISTFVLFGGAQLTNMGTPEPFGFDFLLSLMCCLYQFYSRH
jgi:hypothetical protein